MARTLPTATDTHEEGFWGYPLWLRVGFGFCVVVALGVVARRLKELISPSASVRPGLGYLDAVFASHTALTAAHIVPAAAFVLASVAVLWGARAGRVLKAVFYGSGAITGLTAYAMSRYAVGGWIERSAVFVFDTWFLISLAAAWRWAMRGDAAREREWSTRAVGVLLGIATTRPVMGVFFATASRTGLVPEQFFGMAFWVGFAINTVVVEGWLAYRRTRLRRS